VPLDRWTEYKENGQSVLRDSVYEHYGGLFVLLPNAPQLTDRELEAWFQPPLTGRTRSAVDRSIRTFRKLCQFAGVVLDNRIVGSSVSSKLLEGSRRSAMSCGPSGERSLPVLNPPHDSSDYVKFFRAYKAIFFDQ
jgi:hypothetical protein